MTQENDKYQKQNKKTNKKPPGYHFEIDKKVKSVKCFCFEIFTYEVLIHVSIERALWKNLCTEKTTT